MPRWVCRCELPPGTKRDWGPKTPVAHFSAHPQDRATSKPQEKERAATTSNTPAHKSYFTDSTHYQKVRREPKPQDFGLTESRVKYFVREHFGLSEHQESVVLWTFFGIAYLYVISWAEEFSWGWVFTAAVLTLFLGMVPISLALVVVTALIKKVHRYAHGIAIRHSSDYGRYQQYTKAITAYQGYLSELRHQEYLNEQARRKAEEEEKRKQVEWWQSLDGHRFELELAELLRKRGFDVELTSPSGDQGVDLFLKRSGRTVVVQCKAHADYVSPGVVRDLYGTMIHFKADEAWLVTTSGFHKGAKSFAESKPIRLITIAELLEQ